jgi:hypothetical protein
MNRSVGVTVISVLAFIGSILVLLMGILMAVVMVVAPPPAQQDFPASPVVFKALMLAVSFMYVLPAIWGILTSIGLFRLRNWARISTIVFSVLLILMSGFAALTVLLIPLFAVPNGAMDPSVFRVMQICMGAFCLTQLGIGIWWLVFFNRARVKQQFVPQAIPVAATPMGSSYAVPTLAPSAAEARTISRRPLSLTILAWFLLVGCLFMPLSFVLHPPIPLFTRLLTGWPAAMYLTIAALLQLYVGIGLLRLKSAARLAGVGYFGFAFVNSAVFYFAPGSHARLLALAEQQQSMFPWVNVWQSHAAFQFDLTPFLWIGACVGMATIVVVLYFLITRKEAFETAALAA